MQIPFSSTLRSGRASLLFLPLLILLLSVSAWAGCGDGADEPDAAAEGNTDGGTNGGAGDEEGVSEDIGEKVEDVDGKLNLKIRPRAGDVFTYQLVNNSSLSVQDLKQSEKATFDFTIRVMNVNDDGSAVLGVTYDRIRASVTAPVPQVIPGKSGDSTATTGDTASRVEMVNRTIQLDTKGKSDKDVIGAERYRALIGRQMLVTLAPDGTVQDVANVDQIVSALLKELGKRKEDFKPQEIELAKQSFRMELATLISSIFLRLLPEKSVDVGEKWDRVDTTPVNGLAARTTYTYTLEGVREVDGERFGNVTAALTTAFKDKTIDNQLLKMNIEKVDVSGSGTSLVSLTTGFPAQKTTNLRFVLSGVGTAKAGDFKGKSERLTQQMVTSTTLKRTGYKAGSDT